MTTPAIPPTTQRDWLAARARATPTATAVIFGAERWSYARLDAAADQWAARLAAAGTRAGDRIALLLANSPDAVALIHAVARLGAILVPLNRRLATPELAGQLAATRCRLLLCDAATADQARAAAGAVPVFSVVARAAAPSLPEASGPIVAPPFDFGAVQAVVFTSGTTGRPKGAQLTFANHFWSATASAFRLGTLPDDRWLNCLPLYHVAGLAILLRACLYGTAVVLHDGFDIDRILDDLDTAGVTLISLVPTMLTWLMDARGERPWPAALRLVLLGGAAATPALLERARAAGLPVSPTYGLTEATTQVATARPADAARKPGSVGRPLLFTDVRVVDDRGRPLPAGEIGEIVVAGPIVMAGYLDDPAATATALRDGWLHTGDLGYLDDAGDLWLVQRRSDLIVSGGENIYPSEVEAALRAHPGVADVCVVGLPDAEWGQRVAALVARAPGADVSAEALLADARRRLAGYKLPRLVRFVDALPQTGSGKVARQAVAAVLAEAG